MNQFEKLLDKVGASVDQATKKIGLYYKTKATLNNKESLSDPKKREQAVQSFQRWLNTNAQKMFPENTPDQLMLLDGTILKTPNHDLNAEHHTIKIDNIEEWMKSNEPNSADI